MVTDEHTYILTCSFIYIDDSSVFINNASSLIPRSLAALQFGKRIATFFIINSEKERYILLTGHHHLKGVGKKLGVLKLRVFT